MEIIKLKLKDIKPYERNAKVHTEQQIEQIKESIKQFGMNDPIGVWGENNIIVEGHGRYLALQELGIEEVDCIRLDHLTDEERKAYTLAHNKINMNTDFNYEILDSELDEIININMDEFGFEKIDIDWDDIEDLSDETYEKPEKDMLECPHCHHVDSKIHFKKVDGVAIAEEISEEE